MITNAEIIKSRLIRYYNVSPDRIFIISLRPALSVNNFNLEKIDKEKISPLKKNIIYLIIIFIIPAMYLPHKNHRIIIDTLKKLKLKNIKFDVVFTGSDTGYKKNLVNYAKTQNVSENIKFLNFVEDHELPYVYLNSKIIVFPVLIGPTFIPVWEAFKMKKPVIFSNLNGIKNVYGDAVLYIDPFNSNDIAKAIEKIINDKSTEENLVKNGAAQLQKIENEDQYSQIFSIINNYRKIKNLGY